MERLLSTELATWLGQDQRLPIVLRGARQVGKTWLVHDLAQRSGRHLVAIDFERNPEMARAFERRDPRRVLDDIALAIDRHIEPTDALLFLDEIQSAPGVLAALRWFAEELPSLPVIAAGSLLEFALTELQHGVPVGRISYRHVEPMRFCEFLRAHDQHRLLERLGEWHPGQDLGATGHERALEWYERFSMVGGMPGVVAADVEHGEPERCRRLQQDLMAAYRDDFAKYIGRMPPAILDALLLAVANLIGGKFVYARVGDGVKQHQAKQALELLASARLVTIATHTHAGGIPLGGDVNPRNRKAFLLDVGLLHALLGTPAGPRYPPWRTLAPAVRAKLSEQLAAQQLRVLDPGSGQEPSLHYWQRVGGRPGEVDLIVQVGHLVVPVEMKAGAAGAMKSLHQFMHDKRLRLAVRVDINPPSLQEVDVKTTQGDSVRYRLLGLPGYLLWRAAELITALAE